VVYDYLSLIGLNIYIDEEKRTDCLAFHGIKELVSKWGDTSIGIFVTCSDEHYI